MYRVISIIELCSFIFEYSDIDKFAVTVIKTVTWVAFGPFILGFPVVLRPFRTFKS
jgi:hypothetical protein